MSSTYTPGRSKPKRYGRGLYWFAVIMVVVPVVLGLIARNSQPVESCVPKKYDSIVTGTLLKDLAKRHDVDANDIMEFNGLESGDGLTIANGTELEIPCHG